MPKIVSQRLDASSVLVLAGIVLIALKLLGVIGWSWWLVTAPFWFAFALAAAIFVVLGLWAVVNRVLP